MIIKNSNDRYKVQGDSYVGWLNTTKNTDGNFCKSGIYHP